MFESGRRSLWKDTPGTAESERLNFELSEPNDTFYNNFWYENIIQKKNGHTYHTLLTTSESSTDYGYAEESYVDNSEAFSDSFPSGFKTELGGFYINTGKLKLVSLAPKTTTQEERLEKKKFPNLKKMIKKTKRDTKQKELLKELKKMKLPFILRKPALEDVQEKQNRCNSSDVSVTAHKSAENETELGGFYINTGKLKLVSLSPKTTTQEERLVKKKFPNLKKMIKKNKA